MRLTTLQAEALAKLIAHPVYVGMRNWKPFIPEAVRRLSDDGVERVVAVCLAPQNSRTSIGLYRKYLMDAVEQVSPGLAVDFIESWHDHPGLIEAFRERVEAALLPRDTKPAALFPSSLPPIVCRNGRLPRATPTSGRCGRRRLWWRGQRASPNIAWHSKARG